MNPDPESYSGNTGTPTLLHCRVSKARHPETPGTELDAAGSLGSRPLEIWL